jgi:sigma-B regulation protein RsbU (phosphoserine phosphatase)
VDGYPEEGESNRVNSYSTRDPVLGCRGFGKRNSGNCETRKKAMRILIVEDDAITLLLLSRIFEEWGYEVIKASDGKEAWDMMKKDPISFVVTDWKMPRMDGLELCKKIRSANFPGYVYVMLLTTSHEKQELIKAMEAGVDDFVVKPPTSRELNARIRAGERILKLEKDLEERNKKLSESNKKLTEAYSVIKRDLEAAAEIQSSLLPESASIVYGIQFDWIFIPCTFVAGDIFNYFKLDEHHLGFYLLDVAGHGISAAMLSVALSKVLSPVNHQECLLKPSNPDLGPPYYELTSPALAVQSLNDRFQADGDTSRYFTMVYGIIDTRDGRTSMTQAGHPPPILLRKGAQHASTMGSGGYPVGLMPDLAYEENEVHLEKGDRLILYSDGITECANNEKEQFSTERLMALLEKGKDLTMNELMGRIEQHLRQWKGNDEFEDDITLLAMEIV